MTLPNPGSWQGIIEEASPQLFKDVTTLRDNVLTDGALSMKVKVLMTMLCDALLAHDHGVENIAIEHELSVQLKRRLLRL